MEHANGTVFILLGLISGFILYFVFKGRAGRELYIRPIAGLASIEEAVGRATELGKPMLFSLGLGGLSGATFAGLAVLDYVARLSARYNTRLIVPICDPTVFPVAEEVCRQAYASEGKLDAFNIEDVRYITSDQFGYASGVVGLMHRERVGSNFFFGSFAAESLILAESGQIIGAMQVAGTDSTLQVPFFICTCDYTVIGEELYAASAYLTKQPIFISSLIGQDFSKLLLLVIIIFGITTTFWFGTKPETNFFAKLFEPIIDPHKYKDWYYKFFEFLGSIFS